MRTTSTRALRAARATTTVGTEDPSAGERVLGERAAQQQERVAAQREEVRHRLVLVAVGGRAAQRELLAGGGRRAVEPGEQVGVEVVPEREAHPEHLRTAAAEGPGTAVRGVAELVGDGADPLPGLLARPGRVAEDDRHQRPGDPGARGDVPHRRPAGHALTLGPGLTEARAAG